MITRILLTVPFCFAVAMPLIGCRGDRTETGACVTANSCAEDVTAPDCRDRNGVFCESMTCGQALASDTTCPGMPHAPLAREG